MKLLRILLTGVLLAELLAIGVLVLYPSKPIVPPLPSMDGYNTYTVSKLRALRSNCDLLSQEDWMDLSDAYIAHGFYPEAEAAARVACELAPEDSQLCFRWAFCLSAMGLMEEAISRYQQAIELGHTSPQDVWYLMGRDYLRLEQVEHGRRALEKAEPLVAASFELAKLDVRSGHAATSIKRLERIQADYANASTPFWLRADAESQLGDKAAARDYRLISQLNRGKFPTPLDAFRDRYLAKLNKFALAKFVEEQRPKVEHGQARNVKQAIEGLGLEGFEPQLADLLANVEFAMGNSRLQQQQLERIIALDGASTYRCLRLARAYAVDGKAEEAIELLKTGLRLDGRDSVQESRELLIELYEQLGDLPRARFHVSRLFAWEGNEAMQTADMSTAREKLASSVAIDPSQAETWYLLSLVEGLLGNRDGQRQAIASCLQANPNHGRALSWLGENSK
ncbi:MAG: tetratricopeptide repeat protein [Planctomycetales bacterium]|nr:tetratricopeptide repeat protein [Planctomycetales bacterium]